MNQRSDLERIHALETSVTVLNKDSDIHTKTLEKIDDVIDRAETHIEALNRSIYIYEERLRSQEKINDRMEASLKEINHKLDNFMVEIEEKIDDHEEKRNQFLEKLRTEIITQIVANKPPVKEDNKFKVYKFFVDNWKPFVFVAAILGGLLFNKWGLLTSLLSS